MRLLTLARLLLVVLAALAGTSCFGPNIGDGRVECAPLDDDCPPGFQCRACDHRCWRNPNLACEIDGGGTPDAPEDDGAVTDAVTDAPEGMDGAVDSSFPDVPGLIDVMPLPDSPILPSCPNGVCEPASGETPCNCIDCGGSCGDSFCCAPGECGSCPECATDPLCVPPMDAGGCVVGCPDGGSTYGDGGGGCTCGCGMGTCAGGCASCCGSNICGNGSCEPIAGETSTSCPCDCSFTGDGGSGTCGNGICDWMTGGEDCTTCPTDCTLPPMVPGCIGSPSCDVASGENCLNCPSQCGACCGSPTFCNCQTCPAGCPCGACPP